ncbi:hypothetical protein K402DRAFT_420948 [Aulographum hederae CBS 113979]|uniref:Uncharacterized protein n=1 Tax=Aulographum hederae CBS 113979 TaxID=1176131 RepID=A0A6G1H1G8_9PEZI|nr:hypothetical protein K402DRAFT_420948 [Aulographum hederae CBS 113979]
MAPPIEPTKAIPTHLRHLPKQSSALRSSTLSSEFTGTNSDANRQAFNSSFARRPTTGNAMASVSFPTPTRGLARASEQIRSVFRAARQRGRPWPPSGYDHELEKRYIHIGSWAREEYRMRALKLHPKQCRGVFKEYTPKKELLKQKEGQKKPQLLPHRRR